MELVEKDKLRTRKFDSYWGNELQNVFNDIAENYDEANDFFSFGMWNHIRHRFIKNIVLSDNDEVLDVCAGTNAVSIDLLTKNDSIMVTAFDRSKAMQKIGSARAAEKGYKIKSVIGDAHKLPFMDNEFDIVTLEAATRHLVVNDVFKEIRRVLKPGGFFYHCDLVKPSNRVVAFIYYNYLRVMMPVTTLLFFRSKEFLGFRNRALQLAKYFIEAIDVFYTAEELSMLMEDNGFKNIDTKKLFLGTVAFHQAQLL